MTRFLVPHLFTIDLILFIRANMDEMSKTSDFFYQLRRKMRLLRSGMAQFVVQPGLRMQANTNLFARKVVYAYDDTARSTPTFRAPSCDLDKRKL